MMRTRGLLSSIRVPLSQPGGVHGRKTTPVQWRLQPLFRRDGDQRFKTGTEASQMLIDEAHRRDKHMSEFIESYQQVMKSLAVVFDRSPKYAWIAKQLLEPERTIKFRVAWLDDSGNSRVNRGWRIQYSSALGPFEGGLHFNTQMNASRMKAIGFDNVVRNALTGLPVGAGVGGADFNPNNKSEAEIQRFCQSYMTELSKYIGPDVDVPSMGLGVGPKEIGFLYGQYKRVNKHTGHKGRGLLWGGLPEYPMATGYGVVHFAKEMLQAKGHSLQGKRCVILGSGKVALAVAEKLIELGAVPITLSDTSGHVYEEAGFDMQKLRTIKKIKDERGARLGRYIISSTTAKFSEPQNIFSIQGDLLFACANTGTVSAQDASMLADNGYMAMIEGSNQACNLETIAVLKKRGLMYAPFRAALSGGVFLNGIQLELQPMGSGETVDSRVAAAMSQVYADVAATAKEFNTRGDLSAGANIAGFLRVADVMLAHGAV